VGINLIKGYIFTKPKNQTTQDKGRIKNEGEVYVML